MSPAETRVLRVLSGGAAQGVITRLAPAFEAWAGVRLEAGFGAVGTMRSRLLAGEPVDVVVLSATLIEALKRSDHLSPGSDRGLGRVATGVACMPDAPRPAIDDSASWRASLARCSGLYVPDLTQSTAGQHVAAMLQHLGLADALRGRIHEFANGQAAMAALARSADARALGCTQATEILNTPGVVLAGPLPPEHALETEYRAAVTAGTARPQLAAALVHRLCEHDNIALRHACGFNH